ncbi:MAG: hypothetical protein JO235_21020 [Chroococcidiopsidaceae cyanobacterium CP_BM_RX_35]|nr:hypothetical protein [Chroococcidiopsidaceae cyanobacterium CP_BM_RX_35]
MTNSRFGAAATTGFFGNFFNRFLDDRMVHQVPCRFSFTTWLSMEDVEANIAPSETVEPKSHAWCFYAPRHVIAAHCQLLKDRCLQQSARLSASLQVAKATSLTMLSPSTPDKERFSQVMNG